MQKIKFTKNILNKAYKIEGKSVSEIALEYDCSENKVNYWMKKFGISKRNISEAIYKKHNPNGDPFKEKKNKTKKEYFLFGLGIGLYWGEGTKSNKHAVRLGNSDPHLIKAFIVFLKENYKIDFKKVRFGLQLFSDINKNTALKYWERELKVSRFQFYKPVISASQSTGTYKRKAKYGVLTIYFNNKKLRDLLCNNIEELKRIY